MGVCWNWNTYTSLKEGISCHTIELKRVEDALLEWFAEIERSFLRRHGQRQIAVERGARGVEIS